MRLREISPTQPKAVKTADQQRIAGLKQQAKRAQKTAQIAQQQATMKKATEKLAKLRQGPSASALD